MPTATQNKQTGKVLTPPLTMKQKALIARQHARNAHRHTKGVQKQIAPIAAMGVLVLASAALNAAKAASDADAAILGGTAATCVVIAVVAAHQFRQRLDDKKSVQRATFFVAVCGAWLTSTTVVGLSWDAAAVLVAVGSALSLHWWAKHRIPNRVPTQPAYDAPRRDVDLYAQLWAQNLGTSDALAGTRLENRTIIDAGERYVLRLVPGKQTYTQVLGMLEKIRSGLDLKPDEDFIVERHPVLPASCLQLTIVTKSPIKDDVLWPGPAAFNSDTGRVDLGPFTDGEGVASWRVYTNNSLWGGYLTGSTGSGKSRMFESLAVSIAASDTHPTVVWFADGDEGASSAMLAEHADHKALDPEFSQAEAMFAGALALMKLRRAENIVNGWEGFTPTHDRPGVLIFIDECHLLFADSDLRAMAAEIARRGRKVGVNIVAASQVGTLDAFGGAGTPHSDALRSSLRSGNGVILRSLTNNTKQVFNVDIDPTQFPDMPGYAYYIAAKGSTERTAPFRGYYVNDKLREHWPTRIGWRGLSAEEGNAYGPEYARRNELAEEAREEALAWIAAMKAGTARPGLQQARRLAPQPEGQVFSVAQIPAWDPAEFAPARKTRGRDELHRSHVAVLAQLADGNNRTGSIAEAVELSERQVYNLLKELENDFGLVAPAGVQGRYALTEAGSVA
jgi:hypothetical protein